MCLRSSGGFLEVLPDKVTILADAAERAEDIDEARAEEARKKRRSSSPRTWTTKRRSWLSSGPRCDFRSRRSGAAVTGTRRHRSDIASRARPRLARAISGRPASADWPAALRGEVIPGGRSNLTYIVDDGSGVSWCAARRWRMCCPTAHDMAREYRVLARLQGTGIPVPERHRALRGRLRDRRAFLRHGVDRRPRRSRRPAGRIP